MRRNPYKIGRSSGISPMLKDKLKQLPSLKGREGRWLRRALIGVGVLILVVIAIKFFKPETQLMNTVEIQRIEQRGILKIGVRDDMPGFCEDGEGLEADLAVLLASRLLPNSDEPLKLVECTSKTALTKLKDDSIDIAIAMQPSGQGSAYSYSYPYYTDPILLVTLDQANVNKGLDELKVGYIPDTPAGSAFASYVSKLTAVPEQGIIDKLLKRPKPTADPNGITVDALRYGSYDELIDALKRGGIDAAAMCGSYVNKYFNVLSNDIGVVNYYVCTADVGSVDYCMISSSDEPALTQLADMLIYELKENGTLAELTNKYLG